MKICSYISKIYKPVTHLESVCVSVCVTGVRMPSFCRQGIRPAKDRPFPLLRGPVAVTHWPVVSVGTLLLHAPIHRTRVSPSHSVLYCTVTENLLGGVPQFVLLARGCCGDSCPCAFSYEFWNHLTRIFKDPC